MAMMTLDQNAVRTPANLDRLELTQRALDDVLAQATRRGFFGAASIEVKVQDGVIQQVRRVVERCDR